MPLPRASEQAAADIERLLAEFDTALEAHVLTGSPLPNPDDVLNEIEAAVLVSITAAARQVNPKVTATELAVMVADILTPIAIAVDQSMGRARRTRQQVQRVPEQDDGETVAGWALRVGAVSALVALADRARRQRRTLNVRRTASELGILRQLARPTSAYGRMVVRTRTAINRNTHAADVAENRGLVMYVRDALKGPTDEECEKVDGRYATPRWARRHPVAHPNCTRLTRPARLPPGEFVTLLA